MRKLKILIPVLLILLLLTVPAWADEAEDLTAGLKIKVVDTADGGYKGITDGKYTSFWQSKKRNDPWVIVSSDKPIYGLYLCFEIMPDSYAVQKQSGDSWVTVAEGGKTGFYHEFFELDGLKKIRIISTVKGKESTLGFNEIFAFGKGEVPDWVQRWKKPSGNTDILFFSTHPDDDVLFLGSAITWYAAEQKKDIVVAYLTISNTTRRSEALNGLWTMGVRTYPEFGGFGDKYSNPSTVKQAYKDNGKENKVQGWVAEVIRKYRPAVVVTQDVDGEYGHPQHKMLADAVIKCWDKAADKKTFTDSADKYGAWEIKKLYLHLYGDKKDLTAFDWNVPMASMGGKTANEVSAEAFAMHVTQKGKGPKIKGKKVVLSVEEYGIKRYPNTDFGLYASRVGKDVRHDDFLENIDTEKNVTGTAAEPDPEGLPEEAGTGKTAAEGTDAPDGTAAEEEEQETLGSGEKTDAGGKEGYKFSNMEKPEWADVTLNSRGFVDEGEYILEDAENGHWMYVSKTLRIQIVRTWETPEKVKKKDAKQTFFCFTSEIWCDTDNGELPFTVWSEPGKPREKMKAKHMKDIAAEQPYVYSTSTDYYNYRLDRKGVYEGVVIRDGEILYDKPAPIKTYYNIPTYDTLALFRDGHVESWQSKEKSAEQYIREGALQVYTFGPCLVKDGEFTEYVLKRANRNLNPRHAFGMVEPGHYIDVICEGRQKTTGDGSTGVMMETLAQLMLDRGCPIAVNLDGGQTAVMVFMGKQLNQVGDKQLPYGRPMKEILCFGKQ